MSPLNVVFVHNYYQIPGGEDAVFKNEIALLSSGENSISQYTIHNDQVSSTLARIITALSLPFSFSQYYKIKQHLLETKPDVVHVHNYFPLYSPAVFYACKTVGVPVVHTLHNYRAVCPTALLMFDGNIEERSIKGSSWWAVSQRVYRNSFMGSLALVATVELHKWLGTWQTKVDRYIALTEFSKKKYIEAGWPGHQICAKPNFIEDPFNGINEIDKSGGYALFVGRLSEEKGVDILFPVWKKIGLPLKIIGDGPLKQYVESQSVNAIEFLGRKDKFDVLELIKNASFVLMPSICYEGFPMVLVEAFACGTPALVSRLGSMEEIVEDKVTGLHFDAGSSADLAEKVQWMIDNPEQARQMGKNARAEYLAKYTPEKNYEVLIDIYQQAIKEANKE